MGEQELTKLDRISFDFDKDLCQYLFGKCISIGSDKEYIYELQYFKDEIDYLYEMDEKGTKELLVYLLKNVYEVLKFNQRKNTLSMEEKILLEDLNQASNIADAFAIAFFENNALFLMQILKYFSLPVSDIINSKNNAHNTKDKTVIAKFSNPLNIFSNFVYASENLIFSKEYYRGEYKCMYSKLLERYQDSKENALKKCLDNNESELVEYQDSEEKVLKRYYDVIKGLSIYNKLSYDKLIIDMCKEFILRNTVKENNSNNAYKDILKNMIIRYSTEEIINFLSLDVNGMFLKLLLEDCNFKKEEQEKEDVFLSRNKQRVINKLLLHHNKSKKELEAGNSKQRIVNVDNNKKHIGQMIADKFVTMEANGSVLMKSEAFCQFMIDLYNTDETQYEIIFASIVCDVYKALKWDSLFNENEELGDQLLDQIEETDDINDLYNYILENPDYVDILLYTADNYYSNSDFGVELSILNYFNQVDLNPDITNQDTLGIIEKLDYASRGFLFSKEYISQEYIDLYASLLKQARIDNDGDDVEEEIDVIPYYKYVLDSLKYFNAYSYCQLILDMYTEYYYQIKLMNEEEKDEDEANVINLIETLSYEELIVKITNDDNLLADIVDKYSKYKNYTSYQRSLIKSNTINETEQKTLKKLHKAKGNIKKENLN